MKEIKYYAVINNLVVPSDLYLLAGCWDFESQKPLRVCARVCACACACAFACVCVGVLVRL